MRNENLDLAQSSGSESSPSWAAATTPKASNFNFEFGHQSHNQNQQQQQNAATSGGVEDLTKQFKETLKSSDTLSDDDVLVEGGPTTNITTPGVELDDEVGGIGKENDNLKMSSTSATINVPASNTDYRKKSCSSFLGGGGVTSILYPSSSSSSAKSKSFNYEYPADLDSTSSTGGGGSGDSSSKKPAGKEGKLARFLRRTQSANEDSTCSIMMMKSVGDTSKPEVAGSTTGSIPQTCGTTHQSTQHHHHPQPHHSPHPHRHQLQHQQTYAGGSTSLTVDKFGEDATSGSSGGEEGKSGGGSSSSSSSAARSKRHKFASVGTDMKFRLGFLKRRHTEGTIHSASVRPPPEEAQKWANSFNDLMASKYGQALFKAFLQREFSEENIEFWLAIEDYRKSRQNKLNTKAQKIYNDFIIPQAPKEINLDALTKDSLVTKMAQPTHSTFDQAQKRIQGLLEADAYSRFLKSDLYMELLHPEKYQQASP